MTTQPTHAALQPAKPADTTSGKMAWFAHNGSRIYYEDQGSGDPVLVLPGFTQSIEYLSALREALVAAGYRVIAADLPGCGRSEPQPRVYPATFYADDALVCGPASAPGDRAGAPARLQ